MITMNSDDAGKLANQLFEEAQKPYATGLELLAVLVDAGIVEVVSDPYYQDES